MHWGKEINKGKRRVEIIMLCFKSWIQIKGKDFPQENREILLIEASPSPLNISNPTRKGDPGPM